MHEHLNQRTSGTPGSIVRWSPWKQSLQNLAPWWSLHHQKFPRHPEKGVVLVTFEVMLAWHGVYIYIYYMRVFGHTILIWSWYMRVKTNLLNILYLYIVNDLTLCALYIGQKTYIIIMHVQFSNPGSFCALFIWESICGIEEERQGVGSGIEFSAPMCTVLVASSVAGFSGDDPASGLTPRICGMGGPGTETGGATSSRALSSSFVKSLSSWESENNRWPRVGGSAGSSLEGPIVGESASWESWLSPPRAVAGCHSWGVIGACMVTIAWIEMYMHFNI